jgi:hypothetical protein
MDNRITVGGSVIGSAIQQGSPGATQDFASAYRELLGRLGPEQRGQAEGELTELGTADGARARELMRSLRAIAESALGSAAVQAVLGG